MDPEQKEKREITYKVGWKRGKIKLNPNEAKLQELDGEKAAAEAAPSLSWRQWNERWIWREAGSASDRVLQLLLYVFPVFVFALSVWLVHQLSMLPW